MTEEMFVRVVVLWSLLGMAVCWCLAAPAGVTVTMKTERPSYPCGMPVVLSWSFTNTTDAPVKIYLGKDAFRYTYIVENSSAGAGYPPQPRTPEDYHMLGAGETFLRTEVISEQHPYPSAFPVSFPEGTITLQMAYEGKENWLGKDAAHASGRVAEAVSLQAERTLKVPITAPSAEMIKTMLAKLDSPVWGEQLQALQVLGGYAKTARLPEVHALVAHPWWRIRRELIRALTLSKESMGPLLEQLLADPSYFVRCEAASYCSKRNIPESKLTLYVLMTLSQEAAAKGYIGDVSGTRVPAYVTLCNEPDSRLGDILCARIEVGKEEGILLNHILHGSQVSSKSPWELTAEEKTQVVERWKATRKAEEQYTLEDFDARLQAFRTAAFQDFKLDPRHAEIFNQLSRQAYQHNGIAGAENRAGLAAFGKEAVPTFFFFINNERRWNLCSPALCVLLQEWQVKEALPYLLAQAYEGKPYAALAALRLDKANAYPQLEYLYTTNQGAAVALGQLGEQRALPYMLTERFGKEGELWTKEECAALAAITGETRTVEEWRAWKQEKSGR